MDFWTNHCYHEYVRITCAWISESWEPKEALLILQYVLYPHTGKIIAKLLDDIIATQLLELNRILCTAHVLQLSVRKGLNVIRHLVLYIKKLIDFFDNSPKQAEYLLTAQKDLKFKKHLAIIYFPSWLQSDKNELNDVLCGFEEITILLGENTYITISLMYSAILALVKSLKSLLQQSYIKSDSTDISELTIFDSMEEIIDDAKDLVEIKEVNLKLGIIHKKIDISIPMIMDGILEKVKKVLYDSMHKY
ncbi:9908_t:CDS:2 [Gigaspora margarita]|uniref:9908_t:CDS:1 n=1 Tax=Gigaspora margarita TaxID=4874 RepID=A0ABN7UTA1_GIGMA|nr:9908_t:CDS:2 [Gigaspora margarita]